MGKLRQSELGNARPLINCRLAVQQGQFVRQSDADQYPIPEKLNLAIAIAQILAAFALLWAASIVSGFWKTIPLAIAFAFLMQLGFGLAHEAAHGKLHRNPHINEALGVGLYSLFPGSYHLFAVSHLVHHQRNRSDAELEDYILPTENPWVKRVTYYLILSGLFWVVTPIALLALSVIPGRTIQMPPPGDDAGVIPRYLQLLNSVRPERIRRDLLVTACIWTIAALLLHFKLSHLAVCYAAFAFCWASQQYLYHLRTPRHAVLGALDLNLWTPFRLLYLNFNYHLTHHVAAWVPWIHLPAIAVEPPSRNFLDAYFEQWRPPEPLENAWPPQFQASGPLPSQHEDARTHL